MQHDVDATVDALLTSGTWKGHVDRRTGCMYYSHSKTKQTVWDLHKHVAAEALGRHHPTTLSQRPRTAHTHDDDRSISSQSEVATRNKVVDQQKAMSALFARGSGSAWRRHEVFACEFDFALQQDVRGDMKGALTCFAACQSYCGAALAKVCATEMKIWNEANNFAFSVSSKDGSILSWSIDADTHIVVASVAGVAAAAIRLFGVGSHVPPNLSATIDPTASHPERIAVVSDGCTTILEARLMELLESNVARWSAKTSAKKPPKPNAFDNTCVPPATSSHVQQMLNLYAASKRPTRRVDEINQNIHRQPRASSAHARKMRQLKQQFDESERRSVRDCPAELTLLVAAEHAVDAEIAQICSENRIDLRSAMSFMTL